MPSVRPALKRRSDRPIHGDVSPVAPQINQAVVRLDLPLGFQFHPTDEPLSLAGPSLSSLSHAMDQTHHPEIVVLVIGPNSPSSPQALRSLRPFALLPRRRQLCEDCGNGGDREHRHTSS
uniref:Uncharacterized protein n=1 Tax=Oryza sativa subsp. japonica TaxID=39947 RepID=Q60DT2_ORYSJ|nr:hypothetical protein [Oryza sativa Japonica Group]